MNPIKWAKVKSTYIKSENRFGKPFKLQKQFLHVETTFWTQEVN